MYDNRISSSFFKFSEWVSFENKHSEFIQITSHNCDLIMSNIFVEMSPLTFNLLIQLSPQKINFINYLLNISLIWKFNQIFQLKYFKLNLVFFRRAQVSCFNRLWFRECFPILGGAHPKKSIGKNLNSWQHKNIGNCWLE